MFCYLYLYLTNSKRNLKTNEKYFLSNCHYAELNFTEITFIKKEFKYQLSLTATMKKCFTNRLQTFLLQNKKDQLKMQYSQVHPILNIRSIRINIHKTTLKMYNFVKIRCLLFVCCYYITRPSVDIDFWRKNI